MKFSELSTDRAADVLCEVSVYALNILTDDELRESLKAQIDAEKPQTAGEKYAIGAQKIGQWIPPDPEKASGRCTRHSGCGQRNDR